MSEAEICIACRTERAPKSTYCVKCGKQEWGYVDRLQGESQPEPAEAVKKQEWEYHVVGVTSIAGKLPGQSGVDAELQKRSRDGWRLVSAYSDNDKGVTGHRHVLIFERRFQ